MNPLLKTFDYQPTDSELAELIALRKQQIGNTSDIKLIIYHTHDSLKSLNEALGFNILTNHWNGQEFRTVGFEPSWEYLETHQHWLEVAYLFNSEKGALVLCQLPLSEPLKSLFHI